MPPRRHREVPPSPPPTRSDELRSAIDRLLAIDATPTLLEDWAGADNQETWDQLYQILMGCCRVDPRRAIEAVRHVRAALEGTSPPGSTSSAGSSSPAGGSSSAGSTSLPHGPSPSRDAALSRLEGHALVSAGQPAEATTHYRRAADLYRSAKSRAEEARTTIGWTYALSLAGRPKEAEQVASRGRRLFGSNDWVSRARLDFNVAGAWQLVGKLTRASSAFEAARTEFLEAGLSADAGLAAHNLGVLALMSGRGDDAIRNCQMAVELFSELEGTVYPLYSRTIIAAAQLARGRWNEAIEAIGALKTEFEARGDARARGWLHRELATAFASLGAVEAAIPEAEEAVRVFGEASLEVDEAHASFLHGRLLAVQGRSQAAFQRIEHARRHFEARGNRWQQSLAELELVRLLLSVGDVKEAERRVRSIQPYLVRKDSNGGGAIARALLAEVHLETGRYALALRLASRAYDDAKRYPAKLERPSLALIVARAHEARGDTKDAVRWARTAVRGLEQVLLRFGTRQARILVGGARDPVYGGAIDIVLRSGGRNAERTAVDLLARAKSPNLIEDLLQGQSDVLQPETRAAIVRLRDEILSAATSDDTLDTRSRALQDEMSRLDRRLGAGPRRPPSLVRRALEGRSLRDWSQKLAGRDVLLYDKGANGQWRAFLVQQNGKVRHVPLPDAGTAVEDSWFSLRLLFETASRASRERRVDFLARTLDESLVHMDRLRTALWDPIPWTSDRVVVVPTQELHAVPLESLAFPSDVDVSRLPHPALLDSRSRRTRRGAALLVSGRERDMLRETREIARILERRGLEVKRGTRRRDIEHAAGAMRVLHIAAHGVFHPMGWLLSGIQLADGWFGFEQLRRDRVRGALIHLTSCESGRVGRMPGAEIEGWTTAALAAGAQEVVLAGWRIDGDAARRFATRFYDAWSGGDSAATSARKARASLRAELPHPYYWSPFLVVG
ncbi:MAG: CHAT domain-containing protein [Candidatus Eisenbacteria bacterium]|nr:CHAT domain-containing protein [Candidatus Eisenbacteria bacterium]